MAFTSRCLVAAPNGGRSSTSGFPNCPRPQLPASATLNWLSTCRLSRSTDSRIGIYSDWLAIRVTVRVRVTLRLVVYRQSVHLGVKHLEDHDQRFPLQLSLCGHNPYVTSTLTRGWVWLIMTAGPRYIALARTAQETPLPTAFLQPTLTIIKIFWFQKFRKSHDQRINCKRLKKEHCYTRLSVHYFVAVWISYE
jgi:hypothetical protein